MAATGTTSRTARLRAAGLLVVALAAAALAWRLRPAAGSDDPVDGVVLGCAWVAWLLAGWLALAVAI